MAEFTNDPKMLRKRQRMQEQFEEREREAKEALKEFFREHQQDMARDFLENQHGTPLDPRMARYGRNEGGGFGGVLDESDD